MRAEEARRLLVAERERTRSRLADLEHEVDAIVAGSVDDNADDEHDPEGSTIAFERSRAGSLAHRARRSLEEVAAALARLDDGTYGVCERCGRPVPDARLQARPTARTHTECAPAGPTASRRGRRSG